MSEAGKAPINAEALHLNAYTTESLPTLVDSTRAVAEKAIASESLSESEETAEETSCNADQGSSNNEEGDVESPPRLDLGAGQKPQEFSSVLKGAGGTTPSPPKKEQYLFKIEQNESSGNWSMNSPSKTDLAIPALSRARSGSKENATETSPKEDAKDYDDDSSNDDSSYFADPSNLPSPKSGRRYSHSGSNSLPGNGRLRPSNAISRESDASLSLSDDSEEGVHHSDSVMYPSEGRGITELYPQPRITRVHSVSSLISTSSQNSSESESEVRDELRHVVEVGAAGLKIKTPSGRKSPVLGEHPPSRNSRFYSSPSSAHEPSPPPQIMQSYLPPAGFPHPQAHMMTPDQMNVWVSAEEAARFGARQMSSGTTHSKESTYGYSEDSDSNGLNPTYYTGEEGSGAPEQHQRSKRDRNLKSTDAKDPPSLSTQRQTSSGGYSGRESHMDAHHGGGKGFKVYWQRWIMLLYMSTLNLLSDWTCYSVAPIAVLTKQAFGKINAEQLVVVFLGANAISTACEPILLSRLGLRRTVLFGALLLMLGSIVKSGGMPPIIQSNLKKGEGEWKVYLGFFLVGLSQPLYQCTPALLSASWFPERERTLATGVALNANQLGIGLAFIFGTLLVSDADDIPSYFGLLSIMSTLAFLGTLIQFDDAPPTPPSDTAKVMRGTLEADIPSFRTIFESVRGLGNAAKGRDFDGLRSSAGAGGNYDGHDRSGQDRGSATLRRESSGGKRSSGRKGSRSGSGNHRSSGTTRRRNHSSGARHNGRSDGTTDTGFHGLAPSPAHYGAVGKHKHPQFTGPFPPSPMMPGRVGPDPSRASGDNRDSLEDERESPHADENYAIGAPPPYGFYGFPGADRNMHVFPSGDPMAHGFPPGDPNMPGLGQAYVYPPYHLYQQGYFDPGFNQQMYYPPQSYYEYPPQQPYFYYGYQQPFPPMMYGSMAGSVLPPSEEIDEGAEPILTMSAHHLEISIRDDQILLSTRACLARPGFVHALVAFTVSGIVINTLSTFMDYLVRLNGVGREYTGIVGGSFQFVIMISSLIVGKVCDKTRAYYSVTIGMLVLGAFGLAECGVNLDADRGVALRWSLVVVALLVGPLQPVSTELGVDVVYPLSENTVLVIQQLFSNLLSALFIPCFKAMKDVGLDSSIDPSVDRPEYTFSFYLLIVLHATATVFFATFNGRYVRFEHELEKQAQEERRKAMEAAAAFQPVDDVYRGHPQATESDPLVSPAI